VPEVAKFTAFDVIKLLLDFFCWWSSAR